MYNWVLLQNNVLQNNVSSRAIDGRGDFELLGGLISSVG